MPVATTNLEKLTALRDKHREKWDVWYIPYPDETRWYAQVNEGHPSPPLPAPHSEASAEDLDAWLGDQP
jgi:hypothetical protein